MSLILEKSNLNILELTKTEITTIHEYFKKEGVFFDSQSKIEEVTYDEFTKNEFFMHNFKDFYILRTTDFVQFYLIKNPKLINIYEFDLKTNTFVEEKASNQSSINKFLRIVLTIKYKDNSNLYVGSFKNKEKIKEKELTNNEYYLKFLKDETYRKILNNMLKVIYNNLKEEHKKYAEDLDLEENEKYFIYLKQINADLLTIKNYYYNLDVFLEQKSDKITERAITIYNKSQNNDAMYLNTIILLSCIKEVCLTLNFYKYKVVVNKILKDTSLWKEYKDTIETCKYIHNQFKYLDDASNFDLI